MTSLKKLAALALALALIITQARAEDEDAANRKPVKVVATARIDVANQGALPLYISARSVPRIGKTSSIAARRATARTIPAFPATLKPHLRTPQDERFFSGAGRDSLLNQLSLEPACARPA